MATSIALFHLTTRNESCDAVIRVYLIRERIDYRAHASLFALTWIAHSGGHAPQD
jgi:hypothetical protein